jgi:hypothetical protein
MKQFSAPSSMRLDQNPVHKDIIHIFEEKGLSKPFIQKLINRIMERSSQAFMLPDNDRGDSLIKESFLKSQKTHKAPFSMALKAYRFDVIEDEDDFFNDDIFCYFFVTDGVIPQAHVSSIYKNIDQGQSFFFHPNDSSIFPPNGIDRKGPQNHLIVDYGIVESDRGDIEELKRLSSAIVDIALVVYAAADPTTASLLIGLRKEVKHLASLLLDLGTDDRLAIGSIIYTTDELEKALEKRSIIPFYRIHEGRHYWSRWKYRIGFRLLR